MAIQYVLRYTKRLTCLRLQSAGDLSGYGKLRLIGSCLASKSINYVASRIASAYYNFQCPEQMLSHLHVLVRVRSLKEFS